MSISPLPGKRKDSTFCHEPTEQSPKKRKTEDKIKKIGPKTLKKVTSNQSTEHESDKLNLLDLSDELLIKIIKHCDNRDQASLACSCKSLNRIVNDRAFQTEKTAKLIGLRKVNNSWITSYRELEKNLESIKDYIDTSIMNIEAKNAALSNLIIAYITANKTKVAKKLTEQIQNNDYLSLSMKLKALAWDYKINSKANTDEMNSLICELESVIDLMEPLYIIYKDKAYLDLLNILLLIDQIEKAKLLIDKIENNTVKFQAHLEILKKCKNESEIENVKTFINQIDNDYLKNKFLLNLLKTCQEIDPDYDIAIEKNTILSFIENLPNTLTIWKIEILLEFIDTYQNDIEAKQKTQLYINQLEEGSNLILLNSQLKLALSYLQIGKSSEAKSIIDQISDPYSKCLAIIELLKLDSSNIQTKKQVKLIINELTPDLKISILMKLLAIYPKDLEIKEQIKLLIDQIEQPSSKVKFLLDFIKTYYFDDLDSALIL